MSPRSVPFDAPFADDASLDASKRLQRLRKLAWLMDRSIPAGNGRRFGLDPILGLLPGVGDWISSLLSVYLVYEGARLGLSYSVLSRMALNIGVETVVGSVPVLGDLFDFAWQANARNMALIDQNYRPSLRPRPVGRLIFFIVAVVLILTVFTLTLAFLIARGIWELFSGT